MIQIVYTDNENKKHRVLMRDDDDLSSLALGIPLDPPLDFVDWRGLQESINNALVEDGIYDLHTLESKQGLSIVVNLTKRFVLAGFRNAEASKME
jgi:hypothetical protein